MTAWRWVPRFGLPRRKPAKKCLFSTDSSRKPLGAPQGVSNKGTSYYEKHCFHDPRACCVRPRCLRQGPSSRRRPASRFQERQGLQKVVLDPVKSPVHQSKNQTPPGCLVFLLVPHENPPRHPAHPFPPNLRPFVPAADDFQPRLRPPNAASPAPSSSEPRQDQRLPRPQAPRQK